MIGKNRNGKTSERKKGIDESLNDAGDLDKPVDPDNGKKVSRNSNNSNQSVFQYLTRGSEGNYTHVSEVSPNKGTFLLNYKNVDIFWEEYYKQIQLSKKVNNYTLGIAEKTHQYMPVIVDIDLKIPITTSLNDPNLPKSLYNETQVAKIVKIYQFIIKGLIKNIPSEDLDCCLLTKKPYIKQYKMSNYLKHGFHLHFPKIFLDKNDQKIFLISRVKHALETNCKNLFADLGIENSASVIDESVYSNCWLLYGGVKEKGLFPYLLDKIYREVPSEDSPGKFDLMEISPKKCFKNYIINDYKFKPISMDFSKGKLEQYYPRIFSLIPFGRKTNQIYLDPKLKNIRKPRIEKNRKEYEEMEITDAMSLARSLVGILKINRADDYYQWINVGWALYNISDGEDSGLELWKEFSSKCEEKYCPDRCEYEWDKMEKKGITMGSLKYWALKDDPKRYAEIIKEHAGTYIREKIGGNDFQGDMVKVLYNMYSSQFVCSSISNRNGSWYHFNEHRWEQVDCGVDLWKKIGTELLFIVNKIKQEESNKLNTVIDEAQKLMHQRRVKNLEKLAGKLINGNFKERLMKDAAFMFYDKNFSEKLDSNPNIIPCKNGVYDLDNNIFREGKPEDYISKTLPGNYIEFDPTHPRVEAMLDFISKIFPDPVLREYFIDHLSEVFVGDNRKKIVYMWVGCGDNGKSKMQTLIEKMLGKYAIKIPTTVITSKKPISGSCWPEMARAGNGVRWAVLEEPNEDEKINVGIMKNLSGNDSFFARDAFEKGRDAKEIIPRFKLIFIANKLPAINSMDKATWNRIRVIPFEAVFSRNAPESEEEQIEKKCFPMDEDIDRKLPDMIEPLMWYLLNYRKTKSKIIPEPDKVIAATKEYKEENDHLSMFIDDKFERDEKSELLLDDAYNIYKLWFKENVSGVCQNKKKFSDDMCKLLGPLKSPIKSWRGWNRINCETQVKIDPKNLVDYSDLNAPKNVFAQINGKPKEEYDNSNPLE
jgi:P4 family phage/plasmid primase-like protien